MINTATITFSDGSTLVLNDQEYLAGITFIENKKQIHENDWEKKNREMFPTTAAEGEPFQLWSHSDVGLFIAIADMLNQYDYFVEHEKPYVFYKSSSVIKIEVR